MALLQKPEEITLEQKIKNCKEVVIQNMERTLQQKMVYLFFSNRKIDSEIKSFSLNSKDGIIKIEFNDPEKARNFYDTFNFKEKILLRPFNIYFNLQLNDSEMKKYFIQGVTEDNQRAIFDAARKIGICKLYTNYHGAVAARKLKPKAVLSFIRKEELTEDEFSKLTEDLKKEEVKISAYVAEKGLKCTVNVYNFFTGDTKKEDSEVMVEAQTEIKNLIKSVIKDQLSSVSINVKRREEKVYVTALLEFADNEQAMDNFELLRDSFVNKGQTKAVLFFHNHENNSYFSLYTSGLAKKDQNQSEKQFELQLLKTFRLVNKDVLQVNIYPVQFNKTYIGRIYLRSEEAGKNFIVDYVTKREKLNDFYRDNNRINFNINVDSKTLKKIKQAERKASEIAKNIKNSEESMKKSRKPNPAINQVGLANINIPNPGMGVPFGNPLGGPMMGQIGMMPPGNLLVQNKGGMPPMMGGVVPPMGMLNATSPMGQANPKTKLEQTIRDKQKFLKMQPNTARRLILPSLKYAIQQTGISKAQAQVHAEKILKEQLTEIYKCLQTQDEIKKRVGK